jgi:hypothetical protein
LNPEAVKPGCDPQPLAAKMAGVEQSSLRARNPVVVALYLNAAVLLAILLVMVFRSPAAGLPAAFGQLQAPIAGGGGVFVMPAQFRSDLWGCYLLDVDAQTLCSYEYDAAKRQLRLTSARNFRYDRMLKDFATYPPPWEVQQLVEQEKQDQRVRDSKTPDVNPETVPNLEAVKP